MVVNRNISGLTLSNSLCSECGFIHPTPENGICPIANANSDKKPTQKITTYNQKENLIIYNMQKKIDKLILDRFEELNIQNEYAEKKFFNKISESTISFVTELLNEYKA